MSDETITISKTTLWQGVAALFAVLFVGSLFWGGSGTSGAVVADKPTVKLPTADPQQDAPARVEVTLDGAAAVKGEDNAPVTVVEYSDYQCPFCARFYEQTLPSMMKEYIDSGKVKLVYKDLPLPFHPNAKNAAVAARCGGDQGNYWGMHDELFGNQEVWSNLPDATETFAGYATKLGLDATKFKNCLTSGKFDTVISDNLKEASSVGLSGTPSFLVNGMSVVGAQPFAVFKQAIESELK
ncbi:DsbA family protein [archaeon]|nr:DsbA family protein [archaeon]